MYIMPSAWNLFVKKIYHEGKAKDPNYEFKNALKDASKRKSEMGTSSATTKHKKTKKRGSKKRKTRRHRR
jgi:hypothetical protein